MSPTSGIYWVELGFINNYKEPQLWLVLLRYSADVASAFPWVVIPVNLKIQKGDGGKILWLIEIYEALQNYIHHLVLQIHPITYVVLDPPNIIMLPFSDGFNVEEGRLSITKNLPVYPRFKSLKFLFLVKDSNILKRELLL